MAFVFFFSKYISLYATFNDQSCNDTLTNDFVSYEQLGPGGHRGCKKMTENLLRIQSPITARCRFIKNASLVVTKAVSLVKMAENLPCVSRPFKPLHTHARTVMLA